MTIPLAYTTVTEQAALVASGQVSAVALTEHALGAIARLNPDLKAFTQVFVDQALAEAAALDWALAGGTGPTGPLYGVPIAVKDEIDVAGARTTFGTNAVTHAAAADAEVIRKLRAAGAVIVGKTAMPEFGQWPFTESTTYGYTRNPWNRLFSTAGSSGGTAAAVASGMVAAGLGGDGGGSIRLPSSWCGLFGVKSQRGRISAAPNAALWRGLGVCGPLTRTVADSALLFDVLTGTVPGVDRYQAEPWGVTLTDAIGQDPGKLRIRVLEDPPVAGPSPDQYTLAALRRVADLLAGEGHSVETGHLDGYKAGLTMMAQMAGGIQDELAHLDDRRRLEAATRHGLALYRLLAPLSNSQEAKAAKLADRVLRVFDEVDVLLSPTTPHAALPVGQLDGLGFMRTAKVSLPISTYTAIWNVLGNPAAAVPAGFTPNGLPLSVQVIVAPGAEPLAFQVAAQIERLAPWADRFPPDGLPAPAAAA
ncbi:MAG: hypothetical protein LBR27_05205 [Bifidobacteriaceae bacterium]|jgi:amidase|nr:hypothetical protein [Bifidobacteriaceae bacterium]